MLHASPTKGTSRAFTRTPSRSQEPQEVRFALSWRPTRWDFFHFFCPEYNVTTGEFMTANLSCPNETFINIYGVFYGRGQGSYNICSSSNTGNKSCLPSSDMMGHNSARVYERCQMRRNCSIVVSNDTFHDPCPGVSKLLQIHYTCSPGEQLHFFMIFV